MEIEVKDLVELHALCNTGKSRAIDVTGKVFYETHRMPSSLNPVTYSLHKAGYRFKGNLLTFPHDADIHTKQILHNIIMTTYFESVR